MYVCIYNIYIYTNVSTDSYLHISIYLYIISIYIHNVYLYILYIFVCIRAHSLVVSDLWSEAIGSRFEFRCQLWAEVGSLQ